MGWGITYDGTNPVKDSKTESFIGLWSYDASIRTFGWSPISAYIEIPIIEI